MYRNEKSKILLGKQGLDPTTMKYSSSPMASTAATTTTSTVTKRPCDWVYAQEIPSDITVDAAGVCFCLHKFPLVARSGRIRKLVAEAGPSKCDAAVKIEMQGIPGGADGFEAAAKFCYGIHFEMGPHNVLMVRCAAEYLAMTEDCGEGNLIACAEHYLNQAIEGNTRASLSNALAILSTCKGDLLPFAQSLHIIARCIDAASSRACQEQQDFVAKALPFHPPNPSYLSPRVYNRGSSLSSSQNSNSSKKPSADVAWWFDEFLGLPVDLFRKLILSMKAHGLHHQTLGAAVVHYAQNSLGGLMRKQIIHHHSGRSSDSHHDNPAEAHEQRIIVESVVTLIPPRSNIPVDFLSSLLHAAIYLDATIACRLDLEKHISEQLDHASLDDLLIPSHSFHGDTLFEVDTVRRIVIAFLEQAEEERFEQASDLEDDGALASYLAKTRKGGVFSSSSPIQRSLTKVGKLLDSYLAEIAPDANLSPAKFISLAELLPDNTRAIEDGLYRAIDIYLKAHPALNEMDRKTICGLLNCQKLSQEACRHAAQNERLPVQIVVQVLYFEQMRMRSALPVSNSYMNVPIHRASVETVIPFDDNYHLQYKGFPQRPPISKRMSESIATTTPVPAMNLWNENSFTAVQRQNRELKMEVERMKMQLLVMEEKDQLRRPPTAKTPSSPPLHSSTSTTSSSKAKSSSIFHSFSKKLGKLNPFLKKDPHSHAGQTPDHKVSQRRRRHSMS